MEYTEDALVLKTVNFGESEKMVTLLTAGRGKISAAMKGVRKAGAKLNFAAQPFCFAEYSIAERSGRRTVTSAFLHDGFYPLREDMTLFYAAACVLEACDVLLPEEMPAEGYLVAAVSALNALCEGDKYALLGFLCRAISLAGYPVTLPESEVKRFDFESGSFLLVGAGAPVSESTVQMFRYALVGAGAPSDDGFVRALRLIKAYYSYESCELVSLGELIGLL